MGKITRKTAGREEAPKSDRKRRKKEIDRIHSEFLKARTQLDNVGKERIKDGQRKQSRAKISNRLLPKLVPGIYRNGTKGKNISKAETSENIFKIARLNADALKLFNGNTPESKCIIEISDDETTEKSSNKGFVKHNLEWTPGTLKQSGTSPVLGKVQCQHQCVKKKGEDNIFQKVNPNKIGKPKIKDDLKYVFQKEDICKRRLFQNDENEQLTKLKHKMEAIAAQSQSCNNTDQKTKDNTVNEKKIEQGCSKNSENKSLDLLTYYLQFCNINSAENFESNCLNYQPDPLVTTIQRLKHAYADTFCLQLLRENNKQKLTNVESPSVSMEYQACTSSVSQFSPVNFEVFKCIKNHTLATHLQDISQKINKSHFIQDTKFLKSSGITQHSSTPCSSENTCAAYDTNSFIVENRENNDNQYANQSSGIQHPRGLSFCFVNEKNPIHLDSQETSNHISHLSKNNRDENNIDIVSSHRNIRAIDNAKLKNLIFTNDDVLSAKGHLSKDYFHEKLSTDNCPSEDILPKCDDKINMKNIKQVPTILRRCNVIINKHNHSVQSSFQINDDCREDWCTKSAFSELNITPPSASITIKASRDQNRLKFPESRNGPMKVQDIRESQVDELDLCSNKLNRRNGFSRLDKSLHSQAFETLHDTKAYPEKLPQQEQIASNMRKQIHSNYRSINHLERVNFLNVVKSAKRMQQTTQQSKLHIRERNNAGERDQNQNILFNSVSDTVIPTAVLSFPPNVQTDKKSKKSTCEETYDANCMKKQTNTCRCEQHIYLDSTHCPRKYMSQARHFYEGAVQPTASYNTKSYNNDTNNCINQSNGTQNILLSVEQKYSPRMYLKVSDDQQHAVLLQNVTQPIKYLAVKKDTGIQRIPIYINDGDVKVAENVPLKLIALVDSNTQPNAFPQEVGPHAVSQVIPLQTNNLQFDDVATRNTSNQFVVKHLNSANTILLNPNSKSNIWYASNL